MSLKTFHIVFIVVSTLVAFFAGVWAVFRGMVDGSGLLVAAGLVGFGAGVGLIYYGMAFVRKLKREGIY